MEGETEEYAVMSMLRWAEWINQSQAAAADEPAKKWQI